MVWCEIARLRSSSWMPYVPQRVKGLDDYDDDDDIMFVGKLFVWHCYVTVCKSYKGDTGEELKNVWYLWPPSETSIVMVVLRNKQALSEQTQEGEVDGSWTQPCKITVKNVGKHFTQVTLYFVIFCVSVFHFQKEHEERQTLLHHL